VNEEYNSSIEFASKHYENFPVVSFFLSDYHKKHIATIYKFARIADDIADEENISPKEKLEKLNKYEVELIKALEGKFSSPFWETLQNTISANSLSAEYFFALIRAFKFDVENKGFESFEDILNYCKNSANPVGRLVLEIFNIRNVEAFEYSDKITTALQLTNFYQDVAEDAGKSRIYFPHDEMNKFGVKKEEILDLRFNENFKNLMEFSVKRTKNMFSEGKPLLKFLPPALRSQIKLTIAGGERILEKIEKLKYDTMNNHPKLNFFDAIIILYKAIFNA
jgi:squalene synthase HpnC